MGSFHGNMLTSAFGASIAVSIATAYGCAGISSGRISTGVWYDATADGQKFLMIQENASQSTPRQLEVVQEWFSELRHSSGK